MFAGDNDLHPDNQKAIASIDAHIATINILNVFDEAIVGLEGGQYAIKPFAVLASSFQHVILADADIVFLQSPEVAFSQLGYLATGTLFSHDRIILRSNSDRHAWWHSTMAGRLPSQTMQHSSWWNNQTIDEMESGVVALNKHHKSVLIGLLFIAWMNTRHIRDSTTYKYTHGAYIADLSM